MPLGVMTIVCTQGRRSVISMVGMPYLHSKFHKSIFEEGGEKGVEIVESPAVPVPFPPKLLNNYS
jgi:hypothetical protein